MRIELSDAATLALRDLALQERRDSRRQIEYMVESELARRGLLEPDSNARRMPQREDKV